MRHDKARHINIRRDKAIQHHITPDNIEQPGAIQGNRTQYKTRHAKTILDTPRGYNRTSDKIIQGKTRRDNTRTCNTI